MLYCPLKHKPPYVLLAMRSSSSVGMTKRINIRTCTLPSSIHTCHSSELNSNLCNNWNLVQFLLRYFDLCFSTTKHTLVSHSTSFLPCKHALNKLCKSFNEGIINEQVAITTGHQQIYPSQIFAIFFALILGEYGHLYYKIEINELRMNWKMDLEVVGTF